jgi:hypothetical protein
MFVALGFPVGTNPIHLEKHKSFTERDCPALLARQGDPV